MIQTLAIYFSLEISYKINSIFYHLRRLPVIKRFFAGKSYDMPVFKTIIKAFAVLKEVFSALISKGFYLLAVLVIVGLSYANNLVEQSAPIAPMLFHVLTLWTLVGAILNNHLFEKNDNSYYAIILLRMDAKKYALANYLYTLVKHIVGLLLFGIIFGLLLKLSLLQVILFPFYVVGVKVFVQSLELIFYDKMRENEKSVTAVQMSLVILITALSFLFPVSSLCIPEQVSICIMAAGIVLGVIFSRKIFTYDNYALSYKRELCEYRDSLDKIDVSTEVVSSRAALNDKDVNIRSNKSGFAYMNDLFVKRHRKLLWRTELLMTVAAVLIFVVGVWVVCYGCNEEDLADLNHTILYVVPRILVFVMYALNRGMQYTQALYINCDHSLLTYSFYKERKSILRLFTIRLIDILKVNLPVATVIGIGLDILLYLTGGTDSVINYGVLIVAPVCLSIFFSVHYLVMYYLLQPFDAETKLTNPVYSAVKNITYIVSFVTLQMEFESLYFGMGTIIFCVLYCIIACVLVYIFAPKTFRIRQG